MRHFSLLAILVMIGPFASTATPKASCQPDLVPKTVLAEGEAELRDELLTSMLDNARALVAQGKTDPELARQLRWTANEGVNIQSSEDLKKLTPAQMEALRLVSLLDPHPATWKEDVHFEGAPLEISLGAYPIFGLGRVVAHVTVQDLTLNGTVKERLLGVTFVLPLIDGDNTAVELPAVVRSVPMKWGTGNDRAKIKRRNSVANRHQRQFDHLVLGQPRLRLIHSVTSLSREKVMGRFIYILPGNGLNSRLIMQAPTNESAYAAVAQSLDTIFITAFTGEKEVRVINGYQNGDNKSPIKR